MLHQSLRKSGGLYFLNVFRNQPLLFTTIFVIMVQAAISCLGCCHNLLTDFLLLPLFFLQSVLTTAREASCRSQVRSRETSAPRPRMALPISEKPQSLQWLYSLSLLTSLALSSPALSATTATQLDWPRSALNKPDSIPIQVLSPAVPLDCSSHTSRCSLPF